MTPKSYTHGAHHRYLVRRGGEGEMFQSKFFFAVFFGEENYATVVIDSGGWRKVMVLVLALGLGWLGWGLMMVEDFLDLPDCKELNEPAVLPQPS